MKKQQGRKVLVVFSDGVDRGSKESLAAIEAAQQADTVIYCILSKNDQFCEHRGKRRSRRLGRQRYGRSRRRPTPISSAAGKA
jgi:hypothetical protein